MACLLAFIPTLLFIFRILGVLRVYFPLLESDEQSQKNDWPITKVPLRLYYVKLRCYLAAVEQGLDDAWYAGQGSG